MSRPHRLLAPAAALVFLVAACGDDDDRDPTAATSTTPVEDPATGNDTEPGDDPTAEETVPDAEAEDPPEQSGGADEGLGDPAVFIAELDGAAVAPGPGDPTATGRMEAESTVDGRLCVDMVAEDLGSEVTDAHIHEGAAGASGGVVIPIGPPTTTTGDTASWTDVCVDVDDGVLDRVIADPARFYTNVHTGDLGAGAIRGQLELATIFDLSLS